MPAPDAPGIVALEAIWEVEGQVMENTFHYHMGTPITLADIQELINVYVGWAGANTVLWHTQSQLVKVQARDLSSPAGVSIILNVVPPVAGSNTNDPMPNNVTFALKRQTGIRGRANRGRVFLIGLTEEALDTDKQQFLSGSVAGWLLKYTDLMNHALADALATEVVYHKAAGTGTPVIGYAYADLFVDSQRRRLPGHNRHH